jgi:hypothetical protein
MLEYMKILSLIDASKYCLRNIIESEPKGINTLNPCRGLQFCPDHMLPNECWILARVLFIMP